MENITMTLQGLKSGKTQCYRVPGTEKWLCFDDATGVTLTAKMPKEVADAIKIVEQFTKPTDQKAAAKPATTPVKRTRAPRKKTTPEVAIPVAPGQTSLRTPEIPKAPGADL